MPVTRHLASPMIRPMASPALLALRQDSRALQAEVIPCTCSCTCSLHLQLHPATAPCTLHLLLHLHLQVSSPVANYVKSNPAPPLVRNVVARETVGLHLP